MAPVGGGMALVGADGSIGIYDGRLRLARRLRAYGVGVRGAGQLTHCCEWRGQLLLFTAGGTLAVDMATGRQYRPDSLQIAGAVACPGSSPGWQAVANGSGDVLTLRSDGLASRFNLLPGGLNPSQGGVKIRVAAAGKALYIATNGNGLFCLDPARGAMPSRVEEPAGTDALSDMLLCIMATGDGTLLVGNEAAGVTCVIPGRQTQARYILPEPGGMGSLANTVRQIATRGDGKMFVSTKDNAIYDYNPATGGLQATGRLGPAPTLSLPTGTAIHTLGRAATAFMWTVCAMQPTRPRAIFRQTTFTTWRKTAGAASMWPHGTAGCSWPTTPGSVPSGSGPYSTVRATRGACAACASTAAAGRGWQRATVSTPPTQGRGA